MDVPNLPDLLGKVFAARDALARGEYCECPDPVLTGYDLLCTGCWLRNKSQEVKRVRRSVDAHEHVPGRRLGGRMCEVCTMWPDDPRHHGQPAVGRTSWGETVQGR